MITRLFRYMVVLAVLLAPAAAVAPSTPAVTVTATPTSITPGATTVVKAAAPVSDAGTVTQSLTVEIDPAKARLSDSFGITAPSGWALAFCAAPDCSIAGNFSGAVPGTPAAWNAVRAVRATGPLVSDGADAGRQVAARTASGAARSATPATIASSGTGDGLQAFFDADRTRVFNVWHHGGASISAPELQRVDCHVIATGATCLGFPFDPGIETNYRSLGRVVGNRLWIPGAKDGEGFACIDLTAVLAAGPSANTGSPAFCSGASFVRLRAQTGLSTLDKFVFIAGPGTEGSAKETRIWGVSTVGTLLCLDTAAKAACAGQPVGGWNIGFTASTPTSTSIEVWDGRVYVEAGPGTSGSSNRTTCVLASDPTQKCPGFTGANAMKMAGAVVAPRLVALPDASGSIVGMCLMVGNVSNVSSGPRCVDADGDAITTTLPLDSSTTYGFPVTRGTRVYWRGLTQIFGCWDASANAGAGAACTVNASSQVLTAGPYTFTPDPLIDECVWGTFDPQPVLRTYNLTNGLAGCGSVAPVLARFTADALVPRMGCSPTAAVTGWRSFVLGSPTSGSFTSATLTIRNAAGVPIPGWTGITVTPGSTVSLAALSAADTGQSPTFDVQFQGVSGSLTISATVKAVGDSPELCVAPVAVVSCPVGPGPLPPASPVSMAIQGAGFATDAANVTTQFATDSDAVAIAAPSSSQCGGSLSGQAVDSSATPRPIAGVTVTLLDSSGNVVTYPVGHASAGQPVTATTDATGNYSFPDIVAAGYKVRFPSTATASATSATVASGGSGTTTAVSGVATSNVATIVVGGTATVNAVYAIAAHAVADTSAGIAGAAQTAGLTANDIPASSRTMTASSVYLCPAGAAGPFNATTCTLRPTAGSPLTVTGVGTYVLDATTGVVTFTPASGYVGTPAPLAYIARDSAGTVVTSTYTPTVVGPPTAQDNASSGAWDTNQVIAVLGNDQAATGASLVPSTVKLCPTGATAPYTASNCNQPTVAVSGEGTYTANNDGTVTFDPEPGFTGQVQTPVRYVVHDDLGQVASARITPSVSEPSAPIAGPESQPVLPGQVATFTSVLTGQGALASGSGLQTGSTSGPCLVDPADSQCKASFTITGQGTWAIDRTTGVATFTADPAATGPQTPVTYRVTDAVGQTATALLTPVIPPPPTAAADTSSGAWNANQVIDPLHNDTASPPAQLRPGTVAICTTATAASQCSGSTLTINGEGTYTVNNDGTITFDPDPGFRGDATDIRYVVQDSTGQVATATVSATVASPAAPTAGPQQRQVLAGGTATFSNLVAGQGALAGGSGLQTGNTGGPCLVDPSDSQCKASFSIAGEGTWTVDRSTGVATFQADAQAVPGTKTGVTYRVTDAVGQTATSTLTPVVPAPPTAAPDTTVGVPNAAQFIDVTINDDSDPSTALDPGSVRLCPVPTPSPITLAACQLISLQIPGEGSYQVTASGPGAGVITFIPEPGFASPATPRPYVVQDSLGQLAHSTYAPAVVVIPAPSATDDSTIGLVGVDQMINPITNDQPGSGNYPLDPTSVRLCGGSDVAPACTQTSLTTGDGNYTVNPLTGFITFSPVQGMLGTASAVTYSVIDGAGQRTSAQYVPTVFGVGPPVVTASTVSVAYGAPGTMVPQVSPGTAAIDPTKACLAAPGTTCTHGTTSLTRPEGSYLLDISTGIVTFTPTPGFSGTPSDPPLFCASDLLGQTACATLTPTVAPPPPAAPAPYGPGPGQGAPLPGAPTPAALSNVQSTMAGQPVTIPVLANDSPSSGAMLDPATVRLRDPRTGRYATTVTIPGEGTFRVNADGTITFTPEPGFVGTTPSVGYRVSDSLGRTTTSTVTVIVRDTPPPWADPQYGQAMLGRQVAFDPVGANTAGRYPFIPSSVRLRDPETGRWASRVVVSGEGTWTVDPQTGRIRFRPLRTFSGPATPVAYRMANARGQRVMSTLHPLIREKAPALSITTTASHRVLRPGQRSLITLRIRNQGLATTTHTVTRAPIPKGFAVANPMGGTVRGGWIWFRTGNLTAGGATSRTFVLVATTSGAGKGDRALTGVTSSSNTRSATDPTSLRVVAAVARTTAPVAG